MMLQVVRFNTKNRHLFSPASGRYPAVLHGSSIFADARALCHLFLAYVVVDDDDDDKGEDEDDCEIMATMTTNDQLLMLLTMQAKGNDFTDWFRMGYKSYRI